MSEKQARKYSEVLKKTESLPWRVFIIADSTFQGRSSTKSENAQKFGHGQGYAVGHQRTNIILFFNEIIIPLPPFPFYTKKYCRENGLTYKTENDTLIGYLNNPNLYEYTGFHRSAGIVFLTGSGYDGKRIQNTVLAKGWHFVTALKRRRGVKSEAVYAKTRNSEKRDGVAEFFRRYRKIAWETVCIFTGEPERKRKEFRIRHTGTFLRGVGKVRAVCSEFRKKSGGRRKYIACSDLKASPRQILTAYRFRWKIEIFHKHIRFC